MKGPGRVRLIYAKQQKGYLTMAECKECGDFIRSTGEHDLAQCSCNRIALEGFTAYGNPSDFIWHEAD